MKKLLLITTSLLIMSLALAACSYSNQGTTQQPPVDAYSKNSASTPQNVVSTLPASDSAVMVGMTSSSFTPDILTIKAGTTVTWTNESSLVHTVTSDTDLFDSGNMSKEASFSYIFNEPGTYTYHCIPHKAYMIGTIVVTD